MKNPKFNVVWLNDNGEEKQTKQYKSFKEISEDLHLEYHLIRELNKISDGTVQRKFLHPNLKYLSTKLKIESIKHNIVNPKINNPEI